MQIKQEKPKQKNHKRIYADMSIYKVSYIHRYNNVTMSRYKIALYLL